MTTPRDPETVVAAWLDEGPTELPEPNRRAITTAIHSITQRRRGFGSPWRDPFMTGYTRLALTAAAVVVAALGGIYLLSPGPWGVGIGGPGPTPTPTSTPTLGTAEFGTVTLTDEGCTWDRTQSRIFGPRLLAIDVVNETDTFGNFRLYRLTTGYAWEDAAAWVIAENEAIQTNPSKPMGAADFAIEVAGVDALAFEQSRLATNADVRGTYGVLCSSNEPPPGAVFGIYLVGPLVIE